MLKLCPIFDEENTFIGCWSLNKNIQINLDSLSALGDLSEVTFRALSVNTPCRIENIFVDVGNGVQFQGGVFLMIKNELPPNQDLERSGEHAYVLIEKSMVPHLVRCSRFDSRISTPPKSNPVVNRKKSLSRKINCFLSLLVGVIILCIPGFSQSSIPIEFQDDAYIRNRMIKQIVFIYMPGAFLTVLGASTLLKEMKNRQ